MAAERYRVGDGRRDGGERSGAAAPGASARGSSRVSSGLSRVTTPEGSSRVSTAHLVKALSEKLAGQRKMLDEMHAQKAQTSSSWKWW